MTGDARTVFEQMLPQDEIDRLCQQCGVIEQQRKLNLGRLAWAMVILEEEVLVLDGRAIDADVHVSGPEHPLHLRLVGIHTPKGYCFFLTNLPPRIGPRQVADLSRVRWEVELSIRLDKWVHRLDAIDAERPCSVKTLLHASLIASIIAALLAHTRNVKTRPPLAGEPRTGPPLHLRRLALQPAVSCHMSRSTCELGLWCHRSPAGGIRTDDFHDSRGGRGL